VAITTVKGFWKHPVSRILLVIALSNLGSAVGPVISGGWIAARLF
jgi:pheromone shutdown protein TraB